MRQIVLDTETTGLEPKHGHRIIEIGCVEIVNRRKTDRYFHVFLNPGREIEEDAFDKHGISNEFLADKPDFADVAQELMDFIDDSELVIHNAAFDVGFLNAELRKLGKKWGVIKDYCQVVDTLSLARQKHPGQKNTLDALCKRYNIDNSRRDLHRALLDAQILLDVYLAMTGGQETLALDTVTEEKVLDVPDNQLDTNEVLSLTVIEPTAGELALHQAYLDKLAGQNGGRCVWRDAGYD